MQPARLPLWTVRRYIFRVGFQPRFRPCFQPHWQDM